MGVIYMSFTKSDKEFYVSQIVKLKINPKLDALKKDLDEYCDKTARQTISLTDKELEKLPKGLLLTADSFQFYVNNYNVLTHHASKAARVAASSIAYSDVCKILCAGRTAQEVEAFAKKKNAIEEERAQIKRAVQGIVFACSSAKKLLETWPEVVQIIEIDTEVKKQASLVPLVDNVNQLLNLKPVKAVTP